MGHKMHVDANVLTDKEKQALNERKKATPAKKPPVLSEGGVRFSELRAAVVSPDADTSIKGTLTQVADGREETGREAGGKMAENSETLRGAVGVEREDGDNRVKDDGEQQLSRDSDTGKDTGVIADDNMVSAGDQSSMFEEDSFEARRLSSFSSDDYLRSVSQEDGPAGEVGTWKGPRYSDWEAGFQDLLQRQEVALENFSINSFDSDTARLSLSIGEPPSDAFTAGDHTSHHSLAYSPQSLGPLPTIPDEVFSTEAFSNSGTETPSSPVLKKSENEVDGNVRGDESNVESAGGEPEVTDILENSRQLLLKVERTLSQVDDQNLSELQQKDSVETGKNKSKSNNQNHNSTKTLDTLASGIESNNKKGPDHSKETSDASSSPEISIYDSNRISDDDSGDLLMTSSIGASPESAAVFSPYKSSSTSAQSTSEEGVSEQVSSSICEGKGGGEGEHSETVEEENETGPKDKEQRLSTSSQSSSVTKKRGAPPSRMDSSDGTDSTISKPSSRTRTISGASQHSNSTFTGVPRKVSFTRNVSGEMTRSASFECDLKSPTKHRGRVVSKLFEHMDGECPENVVLPEAVVRRWAAEIVIAVSRLHAFGIVCK
jgi:hypothetical protein